VLTSAADSADGESSVVAQPRGQTVSRHHEQTDSFDGVLSADSQSPSLGEYELRTCVHTRLRTMASHSNCGSRDLSPGYISRLVFQSLSLGLLVVFWS